MMAPTTAIEEARMDPQKVLAMLEACSTGNRTEVDALLQENPMYACQQDETTGKSPLMAAAEAGHAMLCQFLLEQQGAPWNAVDRKGQCAGNYATDNQHWDVVNLLVDAGTKAELVLGASIRLQQTATLLSQGSTTKQLDLPNHNASLSNGPVEHEPCTKPGYLQHRLIYNKDGTALLDQDDDAVMMEWERPLMEAHASMLMADNTAKTVLNIGFGMGIIDTALQKYKPSLHIIVEAHPDVYQRMLDEKWNEKPSVRICFGKWQKLLPNLILEGITVDGIFYDTYAESFLDLEDFHALLPRLLNNPNGVYSFFNGLAPDNLFFHGVACQCVKLQLGQLGLDAEFLPCEIQVKDSVWEGVRRKYWHGRDTYYLPVIKWKSETACHTARQANDEDRKKVAPSFTEYTDATGNKRQKTE